MLHSFNQWLQVIDKKELGNVLNALDYNKYSICPNQENVLKVFKECPYNELRVVIIGQDPYYQKVNNECVATGIMFGNKADTPKECISPSLRVLKETLFSINTTEDTDRINFDNTLVKWVNQGVLMLNSALTVIENVPLSHTLLWRPFIVQLLINLSEYKNGIVYVLLGRQAQSLEPYINKKFNNIIKVNHPSYYARGNEVMPNFFKEIDKLLISKNGYSIDWI